MFKLSVLPNGLRICTISMPRMESVSIGLWITAGGRFEEEPQQGISHFLEHLLFKGTKKRSYRRIKEEIEGVGGVLNAFTGEEITCLIAKVIKKNLGIALDVLCDMCLEATLNRADVRRERTVILEEIKMYMDMPSHQVHELMTGLLWPGHPLGRPLAGTAQSVSSLGHNDLRLYKHRLYVPENIILVVAGDVSHPTMVNGVKKHFNRIPSGIKSNYSLWKETQTNARIKFFHKATQQTQFSLGFPAFSATHPDKHALNLLHIILGANMSSRLFNEVREKQGLAYEIGTGAKRFLDCGAFYVHAGVENSKLPAALRVVLKELTKVKAKNIGRDELARAKEYYSGQLLLALEDTMNYMLWCGETMYMYNRFIHPKKMIADIRATGAADVRRVAKFIFQENKINLAIVGPQDGQAINSLRKILTV